MRNRLTQLLADNRRAPRAFVVNALSEDEAEMLLYDAIVGSEVEAEWWGGVAPEPFVRALRGITAGTIHLRINSPGGDVFAARAMEQALREHAARVVVHVDGLAASAASFLAMAGDEVVMAKGAMLMIHNAWTVGIGNADDLRKTADLLAKIDGTLAQTYADRTGKPVSTVAQWMAEETWFTADEAVAEGFADGIAESPKREDAPAAAWNLSAYLRSPARGAAHQPTADDSDSRQQQHAERTRQRVKTMTRLAPIE